jgi:prepilin-type N-terminal cleavage/methylation domain-containing protein
MKTETQIAAKSQRAFTLLEVMIAIGIFAMAVFVILALVSSSLENARRLQRPMVDAGAVASWLSETNQLVEGTYTVNLGDLLGDAYNGYDCTYDVQEVGTNKLFQVGYMIQSTTGDHEVISTMTNLFFSPQSPAGSLDGATVAR